MNGNWQQQTNPEQNYLYNGKEIAEDYGLNWYFYGFRMYDPAVARFTGVDPISSQFPWVTTYNYAENEPIANIDLHGLQKFNTTQFDRNRHGLTKDEKAAFQQGQTEALTFAADIAAGEVIPGYDEGKAISEGNYGEAFWGAVPLAGAIRKLQKRVEVLTDALDNKRITVAAGMDLDSGDIFISTSENRNARPAMRNAMNPDETFIRGEGHAETTLSNSSEKIDVVAASKGICLECELDLRKDNISIGSNLLNDFSKKRKQELNLQEQKIIREQVEGLRNNN